MKHHLLKKRGIIITFCLCILLNINAQTVIYSTDFGTVANVNPPGWTFSGIDMNISTNGASSGYAGASGGAYLGEGNSTAFVNTAGTSFSSSQIGISTAVLQISTLTYSNIVVSFGMRKASGTYDSNATYAFEWSTDNTTYTPINFTEATSGSWGLASGAALSLPAAVNNQATVYLRYTFNRTGTASNIKIDDFKVTSAAAVPVPATIGFLSNDTTVMEQAGMATIYLKIASTNSLVSSVNVVASSLSNATAADYTLATTTVTFAPNSLNNSTQAVTIMINDDVLAENSEYIILKLSNPVNASISGITQHAFYIGDNDKTPPTVTNNLQLNLLSSFSNGTSGANSAEIVAHDPTTQRLYIANSIGAKLDIINFIDPSNPVILNSLNIASYGNINSVAVRNGTLALAIENTNPQDSGKVVFLNKDGIFLSQVNVGMMPDMITFNHAGTKVYTANEGEPNAAYTNDPDGSISIIDISAGVANASRQHITFTAYNGQEAALRAQGIRIFGLNASTSKDFEPEYITISDDDSKAWIALQENNAIVEVNLATNSITAIRSLGSKNFANAPFGFDASNVTSGINLSNFPVKGLYMPDAIAKYKVGNTEYILTANEGDSRNYTGFSEEKRVSQLVLDPVKFPNAAELQNNYTLGRLTVTDKLGDTDNDGDIDSVFCFGARSFSIWNAATGQLVYDSGDDFERITSTNTYSVMFNASNAGSPAKKDRSDDKGPEPEGIAIGTIGASTYAFIALERIGGVMVYDITNPIAPVYVTYVNNRNFATNGPDRGAEGIIFIPQAQSPNGQNIIIAANEVSSTLSIWGIPGCTGSLNTALAVTTPTLFCQGDSTLLQVPLQTGLSYQWKNNTVNIPGATSHTYYAKTAGNYMATLTGTANCFANTINQAIAVKAAPVLTVVATSSSVCAGQSTTITASGANTYTFTGGILNGVSFIPATTTVYTVTGTNALTACQSKATHTITVNALPTLSLTSSNMIICTGQSVNLFAQGMPSTSYTWNPGNTTGSSISVTPASTTIYTVTGMNVNGCSATASITQSVSTCTGIDKHPANPTSVLVIYPNPTNGDFTIKSTTEGRIIISNQLGQVLHTIDLNESNDYLITINGLANGIYYITNSAGNSAPQKIVVAK